MDFVGKIEAAYVGYQTLVKDAESLRKSVFELSQEKDSLTRKVSEQLAEKSRCAEAVKNIELDVEFDNLQRNHAANNRLTKPLKSVYPWPGSNVEERRLSKRDFFCDYDMDGYADSVKTLGVVDDNISVIQCAIDTKTTAISNRQWAYQIVMDKLADNRLHREFLMQLSGREPVEKTACSCQDSPSSDKILARMNQPVSVSPGKSAPVRPGFCVLDAMADNPAHHIPESE